MIPKILHQIWLGPRARPHCMTSWAEKNPAWEYKCWSEPDVAALTLSNPALFAAFDGVYHAQADILRYEILFQFGGIYADADSECLRALDDGLRDAESFACRENDHDPPLIANSFLGAVPRSALYEAILAELSKLDAAAIAAEDRDILYNAAWVLTGPACLSEVVHQDKHQIKLHPSHFFASHGEPGLYAHHWLGSTYRSYTS